MNILLVDDQERMLVATKRLVTWDELGVDEVFTADSAVAARRILGTHMIDIMLTDIEMPGEDGISLQKWQADNYPQVYCIFLTSHADFSYAKEAIRNGAFDYILQPVSIPDMEEVICRCIKNLEERELLLKKSSLYDEQLPNTLESYIVSMFYQRYQFTQMEEWRVDSQTREDEWWYLPCLAVFEQAKAEVVKSLLIKELEKLEICRENIAYVAAPLTKDRIAVLLYGKKNRIELPLMQEKLQSVRQQICEETGGPVTLFLGQYAGEDLPISIGNIIDYQDGMVFKKNEVYFVDGRKSHELRVPDGATWGKWLIRKDSALVKNQIIQSASIRGKAAVSDNQLYAENHP